MKTIIVSKAILQNTIVFLKREGVHELFLSKINCKDEAEYLNQKLTIFDYDTQAKYFEEILPKDKILSKVFDNFIIGFPGLLGATSLFGSLESLYRFEAKIILPRLFLGIKANYVANTENKGTLRIYAEGLNNKSFFVRLTHKILSEFPKLIGFNKSVCLPEIHNEYVDFQLYYERKSSIKSKITRFFKALTLLQKADSIVFNQEEALKEKNVQLSRLNEELQQRINSERTIIESITATINHELNTPLSIAQSKLLIMDKKQDLKELKNALNQLNEVSTSIKKISSLSKGNLEKEAYPESDSIHMYKLK